MGRYCLHFAATGNPNGPDVPPWPAYRRDSESLVDFGDAIRVLNGHRNDQLDLVEKVLRESHPESF
jgi:carboxylesterase type B